MKRVLFILIALLLVVIAWQYFYNRFLNKPRILTEIWLDRVVSEQKIYYKVDYAGVQFEGAYDIFNQNGQEQDNKGFKLKTKRIGQVFEIDLYKDNKIIDSVNFDMLQKKFTLDVQA